MKIAITGHTKGLGAELVKLLEPDHEIMGFSRTNGYDIEQPGTIDRIVDILVGLDPVNKDARDRAFRWIRSNTKYRDHVAKAKYPVRKIE